jgi:hypothetical protein
MFANAKNPHGPAASNKTTPSCSKAPAAKPVEGRQIRTDGQSSPPNLCGSHSKLAGSVSESLLLIFNNDHSRETIRWNPYQKTIENRFLTALHPF